MDIINLNDRFGHRYRVGYDESYYAERGNTARADDPWLQMLLCRHGHIYPHGGDMLAASTNKRGAVANALAALACTTVLQDGDDGVNVAFHVDDFDKVAALMKPRRRRQVSEKERERLGNLGRKNLSSYRQSNIKSSESDPGLLHRTQPDSDAA